MKTETDLKKMTVRQLLDLSRTKGADLEAIAARLKFLGHGDVCLVGAEAFEDGAIVTTRLAHAGITTTNLSRMP